MSWSPIGEWDTLDSGVMKLASDVCKCALQDKLHEDTCRLFKRGFQISGRRLAYNVCCKKDGSIKDLLIFFFFYD